MLLFDNFRGPTPEALIDPSLACLENFSIDAVLNENEYLLSVETLSTALFLSSAVNYY